MFSFKRPYVDQAPVARIAIIWIGLWLILLGMNAYYVAEFGTERAGTPRKRDRTSRPTQQWADARQS